MKLNNRTITLIITCVIFFVLGLITAALGPVLPDLAATTHSTLAEVGAVFTGVFLGALLAQLVSGPLSDRIGRRPVLLAGLILMAAGTLGFTLSPWLWLTLVMAFIAGLGHGAIDLGTNVMIAEVFAEKSVAALNLLNVFFGLGAFVGPALVGIIWKWQHTGLPALWIGVVVVLTQIPFVLRLKEAPAAQPVSARPARSAGWLSGVYGSRLLWLMGAVLLMYVGTETAIGGWTTTYMQVTTRMDLDTAALVASGFWLALTAGRLVSAGLGTRWSPQAVLFTSLGGALAGALLLNFSTGQMAFSIAAVLLTGFSFGSVYPTVIAITTRTFPQNAGKAASVAAAMGSVGGMSLPWLEGVLLVRFGPAAGARFVLAGVLGMLGLYAAVWLQGRRLAAAEAAQLSAAD